jgi:UDP-N-acetylmuramate--alanine ligase
MAEITHFVGIGGIGMSALARILLARGEKVSGSDLQASNITEALQKAGAKISIGHRAENTRGASRVIYTDAAPAENVELVAARQIGLPVLRRSELLALLSKGRRLIAVAGTHGKTTLSAMTALILERAGLDPTVVIGGELDALGGNARPGQGEWMVVEACEAYNSFLDLEPHVAVVTNIEPDHLDFHKSFEALRQSFKQFLSRVPGSGCAVLCLDRPEVAELADNLGVEVLGYGLGDGPGVRAKDISEQSWGSSFRLEENGRRAADLRLRAPGTHNVLNAAGAATAARAAGVSFEEIQAALGDFQGVKRRFEKLGEVGSITIVDDYAHHPTEIRASLSTARNLCAGKLWAVFQPHLYSRTRDLLEEFAESFDAADHVIITDIYPAREKPIPGVDASKLAARAAELYPQKEVEFIRRKEEIGERAASALSGGDWVVFLGAGNIDSEARSLLQQLLGREAMQHSTGR